MVACVVGGFVWGRFILELVARGVEERVGERVQRKVRELKMMKMKKERENEIRIEKVLWRNGPVVEKKESRKGERGGKGKEMEGGLELGWLEAVGCVVVGGVVGSLWV